MVSFLLSEEGQSGEGRVEGQRPRGRCPQGCWKILGHPATLQGPIGNARQAKAGGFGRPGGTWAAGIHRGV